MENWTNEENVEALAWAASLRSLWSEVYVDDNGAILIDENSAAACFVLPLECRAFELYNLIITNDRFEAFLGWTPTGSGSVAFSAFGRGDFAQARSFLTWLMLRGPVMADDLREAIDIEWDVESARWNDVAHLASFHFAGFENVQFDREWQGRVADSGLSPTWPNGIGPPSSLGAEIHDFVQRELVAAG